MVTGEKLPRVTDSGELTVTTLAGSLITINFSGIVIEMSGARMVSDISGQTIAADISGQMVGILASTLIRTADNLSVTGLSGGIALDSGVCNSVTVRNVGISGTVMYVGSNTDPPWVASGQSSYPFGSGHGFWLRDGDGITLDTNNMSNVMVASYISGQYASYIGVDT